MRQDPLLQVSGKISGPQGFSLELGSLTVHDGMGMAILGRSGAGKSTLLRVLAGMMPEGFAFVGQRYVRTNMAFMLQEFALINAYSVRRNVMLGGLLRGERLDHTRAETLLDQVGLAGFGQRKIASLSGGQARRVSLARMLYEDAGIWLLDEPFAGLDVKTRKEVLEEVLVSAAGRSMMLVTHDPREARMLGQPIMVIGQGRLHYFALDAPDGVLLEAMS